MDPMGDNSFACTFCRLRNAGSAPWRLGGYAAIYKIPNGIALHMCTYTSGTTTGSKYKCIYIYIYNLIHISITSQIKKPLDRII